MPSIWCEGFALRLALTDLLSCLSARCVGEEKAAGNRTSFGWSCRLTESAGPVTSPVEVSRIGSGAQFIGGPGHRSGVYKRGEQGGRSAKRVRYSDRA